MVVRHHSDYVDIQVENSCLLADVVKVLINLIILKNLSKWANVIGEEREGDNSSISNLKTHLIFKTSGCLQGL